MKRYQRHRCTSNHRTFNIFARCAVPRAAWVAGEGAYACIAWCRVPTITLFSDPEEAQKARELIDATACGGACTRRHEVVELVR